MQGFFYIYLFRSFYVYFRSSDHLNTYTHTLYITIQTPWEEVRKEMIDEKGLAPEKADQIAEYVLRKGMFSISFIFI